jgi:hypothetical protein
VIIFLAWSFWFSLFIIIMFSIISCYHFSCGKQIASMTCIYISFKKREWESSDECHAIFCLFAWSSFGQLEHKCGLLLFPNYMKPVSWCRLRRAHNWFGETLGGWEFGMGREWGGQFTSNLGPGWTRIAPCKEEGFQVSKRDPGKKGISKGN